jgi:hypothetical protein
MNRKKTTESEKTGEPSKEVGHWKKMNGSHTCAISLQFGATMVHHGNGARHEAR